MPIISLHDLTRDLLAHGKLPPTARDRIYLPNGRPQFKELLAVLQEEGLLSPERDADFLASPDVVKLAALLTEKGVLA
jgi:hypothetical protein